ncbi:hypothetical protein TYRP_001439 [Tyrophagus putrescentiae]|nr:hypothetical protein TYRP_001439 [Tyrophagus putrescentiae]
MKTPTIWGLDVVQVLLALDVIFIFVGLIFLATLIGNCTVMRRIEQFEAAQKEMEQLKREQELKQQQKVKNNSSTQKKIKELKTSNINSKEKSKVMATSSSAANMV